jgi:methyl-accepting chemotaxis protein
MIIICEECGKKYRIDPAKISGNKASFQKPAITSAKSDVKVSKKKEAESTRPGKFRFGLTAKLFSMLIIVSLVPLTMFGGITYKKTKELVQNGTKRHTGQISIGIANHVDEWLDKNVRALRVFADMEDIISMHKLKQKPLLKLMRKEYPWIYLTFTMNINGMNVARDDGNPLIDYSDRQYFKDIMKGKAVAWQTLIGKTSKKPSLVLAVPIKKNNIIVGVFASAMTLEDISRRLLTWEGGDTGLVFLVDKKGTVIASQTDKYDKEKKSGLHQLVSAFKKGQRGLVSFTDNNDRSIIGYIRETAYGWGIIIKQEKTEAFYILDQVLSFAYLFFIITIVFVFIIAWFAGRALSRPIIKLTNAADRISVGELEVKIETKRKDEIGELAEAIARMRDSIRLSIERLRRRR